NTFRLLFTLPQVGVDFRLVPQVVSDNRVHVDKRNRGILLRDLLGGRAGLEGAHDGVERDTCTGDSDNAVGIAVDWHPLKDIRGVHVDTFPLIILRPLAGAHWQTTSGFTPSDWTIRAPCPLSQRRQVRRCAECQPAPDTTHFSLSRLAINENLSSRTRDPHASQLRTPARGAVLALDKRRRCSAICLARSTRQRACTALTPALTP